MLKIAIVAIVLSAHESFGLRLQKKEAPELAKVDYIPYKNLPQYRPDGHQLFASCPANPKIAILVAGRASGMVTPTSTASFKEHVLDYLKSKGATGIAGPTPDVFVHVKTGEGKVVASRASAGKQHSVVSHEMCQEAVVEMQATKNVIVDGWGEVALQRPDCFQTKKQPGDAHAKGEAGYWQSIQGVFQLMNQHEKDNKAKYDIVIFQRPDHNWRHNVDYAKIQESSQSEAPANFYLQNAKSVSCENGHIWGDQLMVLPRRAAAPFMTLYDDLALSQNPRVCGIDRNEDVFWRTQKMLSREGYPVEWTMAKDAP